MPQHNSASDSKLRTITLDFEKILKNGEEQYSGHMEHLLMYHAACARMFTYYIIQGTELRVFDTHPSLIQSRVENCVSDKVRSIQTEHNLSSAELYFLFASMLEYSTKKITGPIFTRFTLKELNLPSQTGPFFGAAHTASPP